MFNVRIDLGVGDLAEDWRLRVAGRRAMLLGRANCFALLATFPKLLWHGWASTLVSWANCFQCSGELRFSTSKPCAANNPLLRMR